MKWTRNKRNGMIRPSTTMRSNQDDETLKPLSAKDIIQPAEELHETSSEREWQIKRLQEQLGVSREIAKKMVDESHGALKPAQPLDESAAHGE
jgi:hypothetical protein